MHCTNIFFYSPIETTNAILQTHKTHYHHQLNQQIVSVFEINELKRNDNTNFLFWKTTQLCYFTIVYYSNLRKPTTGWPQLYLCIDMWRMGTSMVRPWLVGNRLRCILFWGCKGLLPISLWKLQWCVLLYRIQ